MGYTFGCCSKYIQCSDKGICLHLSDEEYNGCQYAKNLNAGRIFYGSKASLLLKAEPVQVKVQQQKIYLDCYNRHFNVGHLGGNNFTYPLTADEYEFLCTSFTETKIPFETICNPEKCVMEGTSVENANSRIIFSMPGSEQQFIIANYNSCKILYKYALGIYKALNTRNITARLECNDSKLNIFVQQKTPKGEAVMPTVSLAPKSVEVKQTPHVELASLQRASYKQISLYQYMNSS